MSTIKLAFSNSIYQTAPRKISLFSKTFPSFSFYNKFLAIIFRASQKAKRGKYDNKAWCQSSYGVLRSLEKKGVDFEISGINFLEQVKKSCVIIGNHMSMMETVVLPIIIQPIRDVTFIVKQPLLDYPVFKHVMRSRDPIAVTRTNPRQDLKDVINGGIDRLDRGISIIVFPQTTRTNQFDASQFTTIGVKLAQRANVPIVPLALKTDAWENGKKLKDFGKINPSKKVCFAFGEPIWVKGRGSEEHQVIIDFIEKKLNEWRD
jgi:1-acyl-sn-glycerol-3-phosphate acyltransferase